MSPTMRRRAAATCAAALLLATFGCASKAPTTPATKPSAQTPAVQTQNSRKPSPATANAGASASSMAKVNEPVTAGTWTITIDDVRGEPMYGGVYPKKGDEYLVLDLGLENHGSSAAKLSNAEFSLADASGKTYAPMANKESQWIGGMQPIAAGDRALALGLMFDVPKGSTGLKLSFSPKGDGGPKLILVR